jgi:hypothetical protein
MQQSVTRCVIGCRSFARRAESDANVRVTREIGRPIMFFVSKTTKWSLITSLKISVACAMYCNICRF